MRVASLAAVLALLVGACAEHVQQAPFEQASTIPETAVKRRELKGRFLHITDIHPDPHYVRGGTFESACHRRAKKLDRRRGASRLDDNGEEEGEDSILRGGGGGSGSGPNGGAGRWGDPLTDCDSSDELIDLVFDWLKKEWADEIDFVVWTGDNVRHDSDRDMPRTPKEIFELNQKMTDRMIETFGKDFPIVPTLGNNDIWPHNIMMPGPNRITEQFLHIWKPFIPEDERHVFERGAHFAREVIPNRLAVISLNTIFWFTSNSAVDGCLAGSSDPGALQMDWLEVQLDSFRERGMQVWLMGHVPPHEGVYYDSCYLRYGDLSLRYQDTIVGHLFGHQNVDHFFFLDVDDLNAKPTSKAKKSFSGFNIVNDAVIAEHTVEDFTFFGPEMPAGRPHLLQSGRFKVLGKTPDEEVMVFGAKGDLLKKSLMDSFENLADPDVFKHKDYAIMNVGPSVLPAYIPSARIFSYNISGVVLEDDFVARPFVPLVQDQEDETDSTEEEDLLLKKECKKPENADKPKCSFKNKPRYSSPESPSRSNKPLTPLGFTQFFLPDIEDQKNKPKFKVEYTTFKTKELLPDNLSGQKRTQPPPVPYHLLPGWDTSIGQAAAVPEPELELDDVNADIDIDTPVNSTKGKGKGKKEKATDRFLKEVKKVTPYKMKDLTINSYIKLSRQLCADKKLWGQFTDYMFVSSGGD